MEIIAHRGFLAGPARPGKGQLAAALSLGFGIEFDIRDSAEGIVLAHDPWDATAEPLGSLLAAVPPAGTLAINIKSCGLAVRIAEELATHRVDPARGFFFDLAVPDHLAYPRYGLPAYARLSEIEPLGDFARRADGIWLDAFGSTWWDCALLADLLRQGRKVCVVSPELHRRERSQTWMQLRESGLHKEANLALCTDYPREALGYFGR